MKIAQRGIITGLVLIVLGIVGYFAGGRASVTALIPTFVGVPILLSSLLARVPSKRKLGMSLAVFFGGLGFLAPLGRLSMKAAQGEFQLGLGTGSMLVMLLVCLMFVLQCVRSFKSKNIR